MFLAVSVATPPEFGKSRWEHSAYRSTDYSPSGWGTGERARYRVLGWTEYNKSAGWDGIFLEDYIAYQGRQELPTHDPWICLAAMALRTSRVRLGTMVTPLSRRRPWKLAREAVPLDHLSGRRLLLGVGLGDLQDAASVG